MIHPDYFNLAGSSAYAPWMCWTKLTKRDGSGAAIEHGSTEVSPLVKGITGLPPLHCNSFC